MQDISIIIVNYNTKKLVIECLKSIENTSEKLKTEVVLIDNNSKDGSTEAFGKLRFENIKLKTIINNENLGFAKASNQGIKVSSGKYILLLNSDTLVKKDTLDKLVDFAQKTPDAGIIGPRLLNKDGSLQASVFHFPTLINAFKEFWLGKTGYFEKYAPKGKKPIEIDSIVGAAFLITPEALKKVGFFDERYFMYFEDLDYCRRVKRDLLKVYYLPSAEVIHYHGESGKGLVGQDVQWRRLIPSSKIYHGRIKHAIINFVIWTGLKFRQLLGKKY